MSILLFLTTLIILLGHHSLSSRLRIPHPHEKLVFIGFAACAQIIMTELILGLLHVLYLPALVGINWAIAFVLVAGRFSENNDYSKLIKADITKLKNGLKNVWRWSTHSTVPGLKPGACSRLTLSGLTSPRPEGRGLKAAEVSNSLTSHLNQHLKFNLRASFTF